MKKAFSRFAASYGMIFVLLLLCAYYSWASFKEQQLDGAEAAKQVAGMIRSNESVLVVAGDSPDDAVFADSLKSSVPGVLESVMGKPSDLREVLERLQEKGAKLDAIAASPTTAKWSLIEKVPERFPALGTPRLVTPHNYRWPSFLKASNLLNIADQTTVIAIIAIGMTMVIITAGIDLSAGSLIALSAVMCCLFIRDNGAENASAMAMTASCLAAIAMCGAVGTFSGVLVTRFAIPPFITTLAMMLVAKGLAERIAKNESIYQVPASFIWLGRSTAFAGIPTVVVLMILLYGVAYILMSHTLVGRYIYAVGGNLEAARLSGVPIRTVTVLVYAVSGCMAGLGGIIMASRLQSGSPKYGETYELYVIAAVVVGGTSLSGGEGKILGTLIGAFIIAVINNGMNLTGVESSMQKIVLGSMILGAVLLDRLKRRGLRRAG